MQRSSHAPGPSAASRLLDTTIRLSGATTQLHCRRVKTTVPIVLGRRLCLRHVFQGQTPSVFSPWQWYDVESSRMLAGSWSHAAKSMRCTAAYQTMLRNSLAVLPEQHHTVFVVNIYSDRVVLQTSPQPKQVSK